VLAASTEEDAPAGQLQEKEDVEALQEHGVHLSSISSSAFLLEREGRLEETVEAWRYILDWCESRGYKLDTEWPRRELEPLRGAASTRA
jgi:hypothetical protein